MSETSDKQYLFSNHDLWLLFIPLIVEQALEYVVGLADSMMVSTIGESAVSGVSLVDFIFGLIISIFAALATGGSVIAGQYLGRKESDNANKAINQTILFSTLISIILMILIYAIKPFILTTIFGEITEDVRSAADIYLTIVALSIPFIAIYNSGAALFRTTGNSRLPMKIMILMNIVNVGGNALLLFGFGMGVEGIAIPTLISRIGAAIIIMILATDPKNVLHLTSWIRRWDWQMIKRILNIGAPYGFENGMFYFGRLVVLGIVTMFGTAAIAANSVGGTIVLFQVLPGMAIGIGLSVVISRCIGANDIGQAKYYAKKITKMVYVSMMISTACVILLMPLILQLYNLSPETSNMVWEIILSHGAVAVLIWPLSYTLPVVFRAAGDAKMPMAVSILAMILCRIVLAYVFGVWCGMGMIGTWIAMYFDWIVKAIVYVLRYRSGKWTKYKAIKEINTKNSA